MESAACSIVSVVMESIVRLNRDWMKVMSTRSVHSSRRACIEEVTMALNICS